MAAEANDLEAFFLHSIPLLFRQVERNLHGDNLNVLEYFERRLDDHLTATSLDPLFYNANNRAQVKTYESLNSAIGFGP